MSTMSKIITYHSLEELGIEWPEWFLKLYSDKLHYDDDGDISYLTDGKWGRSAPELDTNIQKAIDWRNVNEWVLIIIIHECGGISRGEIRRDFIRWTTPGEWLRTEHPLHGSCDGCSDASKATKTHPLQGWDVVW
jgi:hypothetical protein